MSKEVSQTGCSGTSSAVLLMEKEIVRAALAQVARAEIAFHFALIEAAAEMGDSALVIRLLDEGSREPAMDLARPNVLRITGPDNFNIKFPTAVAQAIYQYHFGDVTPRPSYPLQINTTRYIASTGPGYIASTGPGDTGVSARGLVGWTTFYNCEQSCDVCGSAPEGVDPPMCCGEMTCEVETIVVQS